MLILTIHAIQFHLLDRVSIVPHVKNCQLLINHTQYASKEFGTCPLVQCAGQPVLPVGLKDEMGADTVKIFCPKCQCVYHPPPIRSRSSHHGGAGTAGVDGAAFGTTFPHLFLMTFSNLVPDRLTADSAYVPRVFGFRVHMSARQRASASSSALAGTASSNSRQVPAESNKRLSFTRRSGDSKETSGGGRNVSKNDDAMDTKDSGIPDGSSSQPASQQQPQQHAAAAAAAAQQQQLHAAAAAAAAAQGSSSRGAGTLKQQTRAAGAGAAGVAMDDFIGKDDEGNKKSKAGKRRNDDTNKKSSDAAGNGFVDQGISASNSNNGATSKRRRKTDNGNG